MVLPRNLFLVYLQSKYNVKIGESLKYVASQSHNNITNCNDSGVSGDMSSNSHQLSQDFHDVAYLLGQTASCEGIYELYLAPGAIRDNDIRAGRLYVVRFFISDLLG